MSPHNDLHKNALHFLAKNKTAVDIDCTKLAVKFQDGQLVTNTYLLIVIWMDGWDGMDLCIEAHLVRGLYILQEIWSQSTIYHFLKSFKVCLKSTISAQNLPNIVYKSTGLVK